MTSVNELFPKSRKLAYDARQQLSQVQNGLVSPQDLFISLDELSNQLDMMDSLAAREPAAKRDMWRRKILELREDLQSIRTQGERYDRQVSYGVRHAKERDELMRRRRRKVHGSDDERVVNDLTDESRSLHQSHMMVNESLMTGQSTLTDLQEQRKRLRGVNRVLFEITNKLNLTDVTMRIIERRDITDAYLVFAGMIVTLFVIYLCYFR